MPIRNYETIDSRFLQTCDIPAEELFVEPFTMVIFGGAGDLSKRKLIPSIFHLYRDDELSKGFAVLAFDGVKMGESEYRDMMKEAIAGYTDESLDERDSTSCTR